MVATLSQAGAAVGFYASHRMWGPIVGSACALQGEYDLPLWFPHYDKKAECTDFRSFGGWTSPFAKQFSDHAGSSAIAKCGASVDTSTFC